MVLGRACVIPKAFVSPFLVLTLELGSVQAKSNPWIVPPLKLHFPLPPAHHHSPPLVLFVYVCEVSFADIYINTEQQSLSHSLFPRLFFFSFLLFKSAWTFVICSIINNPIWIVQCIHPLLLLSLMSSNMFALGMIVENAFLEDQIFHDIDVFTLVNVLIVANGMDAASNLFKDQPWLYTIAHTLVNVLTCVNMKLVANLLVTYVVHQQHIFVYFPWILEHIGLTLCYIVIFIGSSSTYTHWKKTLCLWFCQLWQILHS